MKVIIAEKPSVAKNIADALKIKSKKDGYFEGEGYFITWAFGHLLQLYDAKDYDSKMTRWKMENFPFIPDHFQYKVKSDPRNRDRQDGGAAKQLRTIKSLIKKREVDGIISACDFDREGQIIGDTIIENINAGKRVYRLLLNEWTPNAILQGLAQLKSNEELLPLRNAGVSRQWADWVIGINLTSAATLKFQKGKGQALNIGRVLLPTLKIIYDRDKEIENFKPETFFKLAALFRTEDGKEYEGFYTEGKEDKFKTKEYLDNISGQLNGAPAIVDDKTTENKRELPPYLFNLSNLQGYITSKYKGWTSSKVLKTAQSLYEKKYITYPRTASNVLDDSLTGKAAKVLEVMKKGLPFEEEVRFRKSKRVFNSAKVDSHSAIMPTYLVPKSLSRDEAIVYEAVKNRFIMQFMPAAEHEETKIITKLRDADLKGFFVSKGRVQLTEGWKKVENIKSKEALLPSVNVNDEVETVKNKVSSHETKPPKPHTEKTLLKVMETCGRSYNEEDTTAEAMEAVLSGFSIGTPATRAETIKKLTDTGYISASGKNLQCTDLGMRLVETFPVKELFDLEFTGRLEKSLADIEKQRFDKERFLQMIYQFTKEAVQQIKTGEDVIIHEIASSKRSTEVLGKCPVCGHGVIEGFKGFGCSNWKNGCKFVVWKNDKFLATMRKKPTKTMVKQLLTKGSANVKGLTSKKGNKFNAILKYEKNPENDYFSWKMEFDKKF